MKCEDLFKEILSRYDANYVQQYFTTQCYRSSKESYIVINSRKTKVSISLFFEADYADDERIYADFINIDGILAWQLKTSESKVEEKIIDIIMMMLKTKHYGRKEKKYFAERMVPLFKDCNFEKIQKKFL